MALLKWRQPLTTYVPNRKSSLMPARQTLQLNQAMRCLKSKPPKSCIVLVFFFAPALGADISLQCYATQRQLVAPIFQFVM